MMTTNFRDISTTKEYIFDYIDAIKIDKSAAGEYAGLKRDFVRLLGRY